MWYSAFLKRILARAGLLGLVVGLLLGASAAARATTLDEVRIKGFVRCGVNQGLPGFSSSDSLGNWAGMDVDICRAVAAAIFSDPDKVAYTPLSAKERFTALQSGEIDILSRNTTWTMLRDTALGLSFAGVTYYDGQGFMVPRSLDVTSALELSGTRVCVQQATTSELNVTDFFSARKMPFTIVPQDKALSALIAYEEGQCNVLTADISQLYSLRLRLKKPEDHVVLPEVISKEPLGPVVRQGDDQWISIVKWTVFAMINAEELGVSSRNVDDMLGSGNPAVRRLLGLDGDFGEKIGLKNDWAYQVIKKVGNYAEIFERNVGKASELKIERGLNALWKDGGILYAPPIR
ncbi:MAG: amino acid ABC transporter substrate-binding protein [Alphaproteobacteria bacterium]|nr:MAG: amino acid ABC transporter substrate-binding protein [Alphaproteobacteria bacterium]